MKKRILSLLLCMLLPVVSGCGEMAPHEVECLGDLQYSKNKDAPEFTVYLRENEALVPYLVLTDNYDGNCLLFREHLLQDDAVYNSNLSYGAYYEGSEIDRFLNDSFLHRLEESVVPVEISITRLESLHGQGRECTTIMRKVFLLSAAEVGDNSGSTILNEGKPLPYFKDLGRRAYKEDGSASSWWLRTPCAWYDNVVCSVDEEGVVGIGGLGGFGETYLSGVRPAFCMAPDTPIVRSENGQYRIKP